MNFLGEMGYDKARARRILEVCIGKRERRGGWRMRESKSGGKRREVKGSEGNEGSEKARKKRRERDKERENGNK